MKKKTPAQQAMSVLAAAGGRATLRKHGKKHFQDAARKRWAKKKGSSVR